MIMKTREYELCIDASLARDYSIASYELLQFG